MTTLPVVLALHVIWAITEGLAARGRPAIAPPPGQLCTALAAGAVVVTSLSFASASREPFTLATSPLCAMPALAGIGLRVAAILRLGDRFLDGVALLPAHHDLETGGVYSFLRHPTELGFLLILGGTVLLADSTAAATALLAWVLPLSLLRIRRENQLLAPLVER